MPWFCDAIVVGFFICCYSLLRCSGHCCCHRCLLFYAFFMWKVSKRCLLFPFGLDCKQGYFYLSATPLACHPCPIDTYQPKPNMENCLPCPLRQMTLGEGSTSCMPIIGESSSRSNVLTVTVSFITEEIGKLLCLVVLTALSFPSLIKNVRPET